MAAYTALVAGLGLLGLLLTAPVALARGPDAAFDTTGFGLLILAFVGALLGTWLAKALAMARPKR